MRIKKNGGQVIHSPLSFAFQMLELGGSYIQKYNTILNEYIPDRALTPYVLKPRLVITDPDGGIPTGEYTSYMTNVSWSLVAYIGTKGTKLVSGTDYVVDASTHAVTIMRNVAVSEVVHVEFSADYLDKTRQQTSQFVWQKDLSTIAEAEYKTTLNVDHPTKVDLSPFKNRGTFLMNAALRNGDEELKEDLCTYLWEKFDEDEKKWVDIDDDDDLWYVSGKNSKTLSVDQDYVQKVILRLTAYPNDDESQQHAMSFMLRRFYGQYDPDTFFVNGKYIFTDTSSVTVGAKVTNRSGNIQKPTRYFDMELFYRMSSGSMWRSIGYGEEAIIMREAQTRDHQSGILCRELSAFMPIELPDGTLLCDEDETPLVAQFPTTSRDVE